MKVLHITPHLGGGIGKAHAVISRALPKGIDQTFLLLEKPIDQRFVHMLQSGGSSVLVAEDLKQVAQLANDTDIVQFEFINHPRLFECLARTAWPPMRSVIWAHISGLFKPIIQPRLITEVSQFVFSSEASLALSNQPVINSGFGFGAATCPRVKQTWPRIAYLGTVNFVKMHPGFFDVVDAIDHVGPVLIWGALDKTVKEVANRMKNPERVQFFGETMRPVDALSQADIFFYPLQPKHYGTGENALVEAMSMGLVPVVMSNPAETKIIQHDKTGLVTNQIEDCVNLLNLLLSSPTLRDRLSESATNHIMETRLPAYSAVKFVDLWRGLLEENSYYSDFVSAIGDSPLDWFFATQHLHGISEPLEQQEYLGTSKGSLAHFQKVFAGDESFKELRDEISTLSGSPPSSGHPSN